MANDDQVFRLTWVFDGKQFSAELNAATANALSSMGSVGDADVRLTNIQSTNVEKRVQARAKDTSSLTAANQGQLKAANDAVSFSAATERQVTSSASSSRNLDALRRSYDALSASIVKTQRDIDKATDIIARNGLESKQGAEAAGLLVVAMQRLGELQTTQKVTSAPTLGGMDVVIRQYNEAVDAAQRYAKQGLDSVLVKYDQATISARSMAGELAAVDSAFKNGIITQEKYTQLNSQIIESYNLGAVAARKFAEEQARLNDAVNKIRNPTTPGQERNFQQASGGFLPPGGGGGVPPSGGGVGGNPPNPPFFPPTGPTGNELRAAAVSPQDLIAAAKESAAQIAVDNQAVYNAILGVSQQVMRAAKDSAAFFQEVADAEREVANASDAVVRKVADLTARFDPATTSAMQLAKEIGSLNDAQRLGVNIAGGYDSALEQLRIKYGQLTEAETALQAAQSKTFAGTSAQANQARATTARVVTPKVIAQGQAESAAQAAKDNQSAINGFIRVNDQAAKSAQESAAVFEKELSALDQLAVNARTVRNQIDPLGAAFDKYGEAVAAADKLVTSGDLNLTERNQVIKLAQYTFDSATASIRKEAQDTYTALKAASDNFQKAQTSKIATPQTIDAGRLLPQLATNVISGQKIDPATIQAAKDLTDNLNKMTVAENNANAAAQKLKDELDPISAIERNLSATIDEYIQHLNDGRISLVQFTAAQQKATDAANIKIADASGLATAQADYDKLTKAADAYKATLNPLINVQKQYAQRIAEVNELVSVNALTQKQANAVLGDFVQKEAAASAALAKANTENLNAQQIQKNFKPILQQASRDFVDFSSTTTHAFGLNRIGFLELQASGINAFQSLAAGISPLRTAETEGAQVLGALIQGGLITVNTLKSVGAPLIGLTAAFIAFGIAVAAAASKSTELRQLNVALSTFHDGTAITARDLQDIEKEFTRTGESASVLKTAVADLARNSGINISATSNILGTARDIGAAFGTDIAGGLKDLTTAIGGGANGIIDLGLRLGVLNQAQVTTILRLNETVGSQKAVKQGYADIVSSLKPYTESLGPAERLSRSITAVWNEFIDSIKESAPVQNALKYIQDLTDKLTNLKTALQKQNETGASSTETNVFSGVLHGALIGAAGGAAVGGAAVSPGIVTIPLGVLGGGLVGGIAGGVAGGFGAYGLSSVGPIGRQGLLPEQVPGSTNISSFEAMNPFSAFIGGGSPFTMPNLSGTSLALPTTSTYNIEAAATAALPGSGTQGATTIQAQTVALASGLTTATNDLLKFDTEVSTLTKGQQEAEQRRIDAETHVDDQFTRDMDAVNASLTRLVTAFDTASANITNIKIPQTIGGMEVGGSTVTGGGIFTDALKQLESGGRDITQQIHDVNSARGTPGQGLFQITDPTFRQFAPMAGYPQYTGALGLPEKVQTAVAAQIPLNRFGADTIRGLQAQFGPLDTSKTVGQLNASFGGAPGVGDSAFAVTHNLNLKPTEAALGPGVEDVKVLAETDRELERQQTLLKALSPLRLQFGEQETANIAKETARIAVLKAGGTETQAIAAGEQAALDVKNQAAATLTKEIETQTLANKVNLEAAKITGTDEVEGLRAAALATATLANQQSPQINIQQRMNQLLVTAATASIDAASKAIPALRLQTSEQEKLAVASGLGADAEHKQTIENLATTATANAYANALASKDPVLIERAKHLYDINLALQKQIDLAQTTTQIHDQETVNTNQVQNATLQISLQGRTSEEINRQVSLLQTKQFLLSKGIDITKDLTAGEKQLAQGYLESVNNVGLINEKLAETQRQQQRVDQLFQGFGETISSTLGTAIENAFSGQKVQNWGAQLKQIIAQVLAQIVQFEFIRPAIGTALQAIGLSQAAQNFGSIGAVTGGSGGVAAIGGGGSGALGTLGNVANTASTASVLSGGSIFGAGGFSSFVNNIGGKIGFASQTEIPIGEAISQGFGPLAQNAAGNATVTVPGSLFGGATLGSTLSGAGLGFGAGTTLNALRGGNTLGGTIGSGLGGIGGSLAGAAIGTAIFPVIGTAIGAALGGLIGGSGGGLLGGLFGNNKPSNAASGANINIGAGGVVSPLQSSGNQQNNQTVNQITSAVSQFTNTLLTLTKGVADSTVNVQAGVRDGIKASITGSSGTTNIQTKDPTDAINQIELNIARGLTNVSDTLKTVLAHITDPAQIQAGITFAATYDDLKQAADSAFSSISADVKTIGPFAAALTSLNTTFSTLTDQANQFGLSLDPINAGLAEATKRLQQDFGAALNTALNTAGNTDFINQLTGVSQGFATNVQDQSAIGLRNDQITTGKVNQLEIEQAQAILSPLTTAQLRIVLDAFKVTNPEISAMAKALLDAGISADSATSSLNTTATALQNFVTGVKAIEDAVKALHTGALAGLTPAQQVTSAQQDFQGQLAVVKAAGAGATGDQLNQLAALAQTVIQTAQSVYGNAPQTADLRNTVIDSLNSVLKVTGPSTGVNLTPTISPAQAAIQASPAVGAAQNTATSAAIAAAAAAAPPVTPTTPAVPVATSTPTQTAAVAPTPTTTTPTVAITSNITAALRDFAAGNNTPAESVSIQNYANQWFAGDVSKVLASYRDNQLPTASLVGQYATGTLPMTTMMFSQGVAANENLQSPAKGTPSGQILVGEKGPEYMLPKGGNWIQVGKTGPEIINQSGGAIILPYPLTPERAFAGGTDNNIGIGDIGGQAAGIGSAISEASGGPSLLGAAGGLLDIPSATLSTLGDVLPIAGPIIGGLIGLATGGNVASSVIGTAASLIGFAVGGPIGGVIGGLVGLVGKLFGPKPSNNASGDLIDLATGNISGFQSSGDKNASNVVAKISAGISTATQTLQAATGGTISGAVNVQDGKRDGIKTSYSGPLGNIDAKWGKADDVVGQFALAIAHNLVGIDPALRDDLSSVNDASALVSTIQTFFSSSAKTDTTAASTAAASAATSTATPIASPPTLQQMYDSVVGNDTTNFNNDTGLQNKVNLVNLLTAYGGLSTDAKTNYLDTISKDPTSFNNTPVGIINKLNLANFLSPSGTVTGENLAPNVDNLMKQYNALPAYAGGTKGTPSGRILVGEKGPEWMYAGNVASMVGYKETLPNMGGWSLVGKRGPEVIDQRGGATILPFPHTPWEAAGRSFALGTDTLPEMTFAAPTAPAPTPTQGGESQATLIKKLDELRSEFVALRRVTAGVGQDASDKAETGNRHLDDINRKTAPAITGPRRQKFG